MTPSNPMLESLIETIGENDTREIVQMFLREFPAALRKLVVDAPGDAGREVHGLKSTARHMGAEALAVRLADLELRFRQNPEARLTHEDVRGLAEEFDKAAAMLRPFSQG
jgi:HPt (histidine-containing phosphotransfer) domain-containing protein